MGEPPDSSVLATTSGASVLPATTLDFHGLGTLKVYAILEHEMVSLNSLTGRESTAIGFFWGCFGAFVAAMLGALVSMPTDVTNAACYASTTVVLGVVSVWFAFQWYLAHRERSVMLKSIRERSAAPVSLQLSPAPTA